MSSQSFHRSPHQKALAEHTWPASAEFWLPDWTSTIAYMPNQMNYRWPTVLLVSEYCSLKCPMLSIRKLNSWGADKSKIDAISNSPTDAMCCNVPVLHFTQGAIYGLTICTNTLIVYQETGKPLGWISWRSVKFQTSTRYPIFHFLLRLIVCNSRPFTHNKTHVQWEPTNVPGRKSETSDHRPREVSSPAGNVIQKTSALTLETNGHELSGSHDLSLKSKDGDSQTRSPSTRRPRAPPQKSMRQIGMFHLYSTLL